MDQINEPDLRAALLGLVSNFSTIRVDPQLHVCGHLLGACAVKPYLGVVWLGCREGTGRLEEREWGFAEKLAGGRVGEGDARSLTRVLFPPVRLITFLGTKDS